MAGTIRRPHAAKPAVIAALLHAPRFRPAWRAVLVLLLAVVCWFAFGPALPALDIEGGDKFGHALAFVALAVTATFCGAPGWRSALIAVTGLLLFGAFIELVQTQLPHRSGEWADLAADAVGLIIGLLLSLTLRRASAGPAATAGVVDGG